MSEKMDYCQYYLSKCVFKTVTPPIHRTYETTKNILDAYKSSSCYIGNTDSRNRFLIGILSGLVSQGSAINNDLDAEKVLQRAIDRVSHIETNEDIFKVLSDYMWYKASEIICSEKKDRVVCLTANMLLEGQKINEWIGEIRKKIEAARYDLQCMVEAENLPLGKKILLGLVKNPDVAWYADGRNISYSETQQRMSDCRAYIQEQEMLYFALLSTNIYREDLRRRYQ